MSSIRARLHRFRGLIGRGRLEREMSEELRGHLEALTERNIAAGMSPDEARHVALRAFGGMEQIRERARDERRSGWGEQIVQDLRYAMRQIFQRPGFAVITIFTLTLAIGVNSATFSIVRDMFLKPIARDARENLVSVYTRREGSGGKDRDYRRFSFREFAGLRTQRSGDSVFTNVAAMAFGVGAIGGDEHQQRSVFCLVSDNYFSVLGARPFAGRFFLPEETRPNAGIPVVVASHAYWQRLGQPSDFVGRELRVNGRDYIVIGIAPPGFGGLHVSISPAVWMPLGAASQNRSGLWGTGSHDLSEPNSYRLELVGTLRPSLSLTAARAQLGPLESLLSAITGGSGPNARRLVIERPARFDLGNDHPVDESYLPRFAMLALGMAACVLLVACLNLANLFLARGITRRREIAIRLSLGASRARVIRQLLLEALVLALAGGAGGVLLSGWVGALSNEFHADLFSAGMFTLILHQPIDASLVAVMFGLCVAAVLVFSVVPAWRATELNLASDLKSAPEASIGTGAWTRFFSLGHCLVMGQIALAVMLLFGAGLFLRGAWNVSRMDYGFATDRGVVANIDYRLGNTSAADIPRRQQALLAHAAKLPGVVQTALASGVPYDFHNNFRRIFAADTPAGESSRHALTTEVSHDYFRTLGITLLRGREFKPDETASDRGPRVAIIDETLATAFFGEKDPLGRRVAFRAGVTTSSPPADGAMEIVGIVRSPRNHVFEDAAPMRVYQPLGQAPSSDIYLHLTVASPDAASGVLSALRRELQTLDPENPVLSARLMRDVVGRNINVALVRLAAIAFGTFGAISLLLAIVGIYGVKAYAVTRRTREIGIRIALGARHGDVLGLVLRQGILQTAVGLSVGVGLALVAGRLLSKMLYRVSPFDPWALLATMLCISLAALAACLIPARRAAKVNPLVALRAE